MPRVQMKGLLVGHRGEVLHGQQVLRPVLKDCTIAAVGNEFVRVLGDSRIQIVLNHQHDGCGLLGLRRVFMNGPGLHGIGRPKTVHVYAAIKPQFFGKFRSQHFVVAGLKVAQRVAQGELFFVGTQNVRAFRGMRDGGIVARMNRKLRGNPGQNRF